LGWFRAAKSGWKYWRQEPEKKRRRG